MKAKEALGFDDIPFEVWKFLGEIWVVLITS